MQRLMSVLLLMVVLSFCLFSTHVNATEILPTENTDIIMSTDVESTEDNYKDTNEDIETVTINAYEQYSKTPTKQLVIEKGSSIELWIPEESGITNVQHVFSHWEDKSGNIVTNDTKFYNDTSIYAKWILEGTYAEVPESPYGPTDNSVDESNKAIQEHEKLVQEQRKAISIKRYTPKIKTLKSKKQKIYIAVNFKYTTDFYRVTYSTNKKFKNKKIVQIKSNSNKQKLNIKNLRKGKVYYVKVQAVKKFNEKEYCSKISKIKKVKIK